MRRQFNQQWRHKAAVEGRELTIREIATLTGFSEDTISLLLRDDARVGREGTSLVPGLAVGLKLGFSPLYLAYGLVRDELARPTRRRRSARTHELLREIQNTLNDEMSQMQQFAVGNRIELAVRAARVQRGMSIVDVADAVIRNGDLDGYTLIDLARAIEWFENGRGRIDQDALLAVVRAIDPQISIGALKTKVAAMHDYHVVTQTLDSIPERLLAGADADTSRAPESTRRPSPPRTQFIWPSSAGFKVSFRTTHLITSALSLDIIDVVQPASGDLRSPVRVVNAMHPGLEFGVVLRGSVLLTLRRDPFPPEHIDDRPDFTGATGVVLHRRFAAGDPLMFRSNLYHRIEFLEPDTSTLSLNFNRTVSLTRAFGRRER